MYSNGEGVPKDAGEALKWYRKAAEHDHASAQHKLGVMYAKGDGVPKDAGEALKWFRKAAEQGVASAQFNLGLMYATGQGVEKDYVEAIKWFRRAADQGNARAQNGLGTVYRNGWGVANDHVEAVKWYRKAAEQDYASAQFNLGSMYGTGQGVAKDYVEAIKWYRKAAEQDDAGAQFSLGVMYANGNGVPKDAGEAFKWFRKAAEQGYAAAQFNLGVMYDIGDGVPKDNVEAYKWFNLAAANGYERAGTHRGILERQMTAEQIADAQRLSREFRPSAGGSANPASEGSLAGRAHDEQVAGTGSGFFITRDGYLVTNAHVVEEGSAFKVLTATGLVPARLVKRDPANDLAMLKAEGQHTALSVAPSRGVKLGQSVATIGFPNVGLQGFSPKLARGEIASLAGAQDDARHFQISVPVQPGNSGGPLVDLRGNVVGVIVGKLNQAAAVATSGTLAENVNYAIKSGFLLSFLESMPPVISQLPQPAARESTFEAIVAEVEKSTVLVVVYR